MRKGCFIKAVIIITILTAVIFYWIDHEGKEFLFQQGKSLAKKYIVDDFENQFNFIKDSPQKDSLETVLNNTLFNLEKFRDLSDKELDIIYSKFKVSLNDSIITSTELKELNILVNERFRK